MFRSAWLVTALCCLLCVWDSDQKINIILSLNKRTINRPTETEIVTSKIRCHTCTDWSYLVSCQPVRVYAPDSSDNSPRLNREFLFTILSRTTDYWQITQIEWTWTSHQHRKENVVLYTRKRDRFGHYNYLTNCLYYLIRLRQWNTFFRLQTTNL